MKFFRKCKGNFFKPKMVWGKKKAGFFSVIGEAKLRAAKKEANNYNDRINWDAMKANYKRKKEFESQSKYSSWV